MKVYALVLSTLALAACGTQKNESSSVNGFPGFTPKYVEANHFTCEVEGGYSVIYSTSSILGQPTLNINAKEEINSFDDINVIGEQIDFASNDDGLSLVSGHHAIPDFKVTTWTLAVPQILLGKNEGARAFATQLTKLEERTSIMGPLPGQEPKTTVLKANCEASAVKF